MRIVNIQVFLQTLPVMGEGMIGIFAGTGVMIAVMLFMNKYVK